MTEDVKKLFKPLGSKKYDPRLEGIKGSVRFDIAGAGSWRVAIVDGKISVSQSAAKADCVISTSEEDALKIYEGQMSLLIAIMQGRAKVKGDLIFAQKIYGLMRARLGARTAPKGRK